MKQLWLVGFAGLIACVVAHADGAQLSNRYVLSQFLGSSNLISKVQGEPKLQGTQLSGARIKRLDSEILTSYEVDLSYSLGHVPGFASVPKECEVTATIKTTSSGLDVSQWGEVTCVE